MGNNIKTIPITRMKKFETGRDVEAKVGKLNRFGNFLRFSIFDPKK
jgi:hypothetical protein